MMTMEQQTFDFTEYKSLKGRAAFEQRVQQGRQPVLDIAGDAYYVNVRIGLLQPADDFSTMGIELDKLEKDHETRRLFFYYDTRSKKVLPYPEEGAAKSTDIVKVSIPNAYFLDPVGMAIKNAKDDARYYTRDHIPLKMYHKAIVTPLQQNRKNTNTKTRTKSKGI